jgi:hypothetical protein
MKTVFEAEQALAQLGEQFSHWRQSRTSLRERIPAPLWDQAVALSQVLPNGQVAKALGLSATDLKNRRLASQARLPVPGAGASFIDVTPTEAGWHHGAGGARIELERPDGVRMRLQCDTGSVALGMVVRAFVEGGRCCS